MNRLRLLLTVTSLTLLTACQPAPSSTYTKPVCGVLFTYDKDFMKQAASEYPALPPASKKLLDDYKVTRTTIRECQHG
jgi:hypothetical protein